MRLVIFTLVLVAIFSQSTHGQTKILTSFMELSQNIQKQKDFLSSVFFLDYSGCDQDCEKAGKIFDAFSQEYQDIVKTFILDCGQMWKQNEERIHLEVCNPEKSQSLPKILFFRPPEEDSNPLLDSKPLQPTTIQFEGVLSFENLIQKAYELIPSFGRTAHTFEEFRQILDEHTIQHQVAIFIDKDDIPIYYKALACYFRHKLEKEDQELIDNYSIFNFPAMQVFNYTSEHDAYYIQSYVGPYQFNPMRAYLWPFAPNQQQRQWKSEFEHYQHRAKNITKIAFHDIPSVLDDDENEEEWLIISIQDSSEKSSSILKEIKKGFEDFFLYFEVDCQESEECKNNFISTYPAIKSIPCAIIFPIGQKNQTRYHVVNKKENIDSQKLSGQLLDFVKEDRHKLDRYGLQYHVTQAQKEQQFAIVWYYNDTNLFTRLQINTLQSQSSFRRYSKTFHVINPEKEDMNEMGFETLPSVMAFAGVNENSKSYNWIPYKFPDHRFSNMMKFYNEVSFQKQSQSMIGKPIQEVTLTSQLEEKCAGNEIKECIIGLLDTVQPEKQTVDLDQLQKSKEFHQDLKYNWIWIDVQCHVEILKKLHLDIVEIPTIIYYNSQTNKYQVMDQDMTVASINNFVININKTKKKGFSQLQEDLDLDQKDCKKINEKLRNDILSEEIKNHEKKHHQLKVEDL